MVGYCQAYPAARFPSQMEICSAYSQEGTARARPQLEDCVPEPRSKGLTQMNGRGWKLSPAPCTGPHALPRRWLHFEEKGCVFLIAQTPCGLAVALSCSAQLLGVEGVVRMVQ